MSENNVLTKARSFTDKLNKNQKWILASIAALAIGGIIALIVALWSPAETTTLVSDLASSDASKVIEYLKANKIDYQLKDNATTIVVPRDRVDEIRMAIANQGLITDSYVGYELFDKTNLGMSEFVQQLNGRRALEGELQRAIKVNPEVREVKVLLNIPKEKLFKDQDKPPTAAVTLKFKSNTSLGKVNILGIQQLIAQSVEGMTPDKVVVTDNFGRILSEEVPDPSTLAGITSSQFKQQKQKEHYLTDKVQQLLDPVFGVGNSKVRLNVEMDFDQLEVSKTDYDPDRQVERSEQTNSDRLRDIDTSFVPGTNMVHDKSNEIRNYEISKADSHFIKGIGAVKRLTVTAIVNERIEVRKLPTGLDTVVSIPRTEEEINGITNSIKTSLGYNEQRGDQITVISIPFVEILADKVTEVNEMNRINSIQWYEKEDTQRLLLLLITLLVTALIMWKLIHAKFAKDKMRIALGLPEKLDKPVLEKFDSKLLALPVEEEIEDEYEEEDDEIFEELPEPEIEPEEDYIEEELTVEEIMDDLDDIQEELELDDEDIITIPDELPEQLFLSGDLLDLNDIITEEDAIITEEDTYNPADSLLERARAALLVEEDVQEEITEDELMKDELRQRITNFIVKSPELALRVFRIFYHQEQ